MVATAARAVSAWIERPEALGRKRGDPRRHRSGRTGRGHTARPRSIHVLLRQCPPDLLPRIGCRGPSMTCRDLVERGGTSMTIALEIAAGMVLTTALVTGMTILAALELGRMVSMNGEQRQVEARPAEPPTFRCAA